MSDRRRPELAPALAYGRHRGPAPANARRAAVIIALFQVDDQWMIPLTVRPKSLQHHGGQICLPGGKIEPGETPRQAALREYCEELGQVARVTQDCGQLSPQYVFGSNNLVHPVVAIIETPSENWVPDPVEVSRVILLPLATLLCETNPVAMQRTKAVRQDNRQVGTLTYSAPAISYRGDQIWGATALILDELAQLLLLQDK